MRHLMDNVCADFTSLQYLKIVRHLNRTRAAIAGHHGRDALVQITAIGAGGRTLERIIAVRVQINEAGRDDQSLGIDDAWAADDGEAAHRNDAFAAERQVSNDARRAAAIVQPAAADDDIGWDRRLPR